MPALHETKEDALGKRLFAARRARRSSPESTLEADIQLKNLRSVGDGTGKRTFASGQGTAGGEGEGGPARGCGWILLRGWTKDALNLAKSGCKVAVNSR